MKRNHQSFSMFFRYRTKLRFLVFSLFLFFSFLKPVESQVIAVFENSEDYLQTDNSQNQTIFILEAEKETYNLLVSKAFSMPETLTFKSDRIKKNQYRCSILYIHPTDVYYVKKILLNLGIEQLKINNKIYSLPDYEPVTK
ncbi:MAG: hypothetical protein AB9834_06760 [Lentimicrobium sp.]